jgi:hypothetical protein
MRATTERPGDLQALERKLAEWRPNSPTDVPPCWEVYRYVVMKNGREALATSGRRAARARSGR